MPRPRLLRGAAVVRPGLLLLALAAAASGEAAPRASVRFQPDVARLAVAPPELRSRLREDPFVYFRYLNSSWAAAVCEAFREELPGLPAAVLHGDAHLEWGDSLMDAATERERADALRSLRLIDGFVRERQPGLPAGSFELKRCGWQQSGGRCRHEGRVF